MRRIMLVAGVLLALVAAMASAFAQTYPARPVRLVVPFPAGRQQRHRRPRRGKRAR